MPRIGLKTIKEVLDMISNFPDDRYKALEGTRDLLGFTPTEWKSMKSFLSKTDNGWLQFMKGDLLIDFKKFVDIDELHLQLKLNKKGKTTKSANYVFDLNEFKKPRIPK